MTIPYLSSAMQANFLSNLNTLIPQINTLYGTSLATITGPRSLARFDDHLNQVIIALNAASGSTIPLVTAAQGSWEASWNSLVNTLNTSVPPPPPPPP